jgi:hypothetical protein
MSNDRPRLQLSATQIIASALAAITATVAASYLGVAGTVIGAAVASVLTVVGNAVYSHSLQRVARLAPPPVRSLPERTAAPRRGWATVAAACAGVFAGVLIVVTAVEIVAGRPLSDMVRGRTGSGTSVLGNTGDSTSSSTPAAPSTPSPTVTVTVTPHVVTRTPTSTVTGTPTTVTETPTVHATPSKSTSAGDTAKPTVSPSAPTSSP